MADMGKKERKLNPAEQKRKADFERICEELEQRGYLKKELTFGILAANIMGILIMLPFVAVSLGIYLIYNPVGEAYLSLSEDIIFLSVLVLLIVLHEAIHGLTWGFFAKGHLKSIRFGVIWKALTPYCTCADPLTKWQYIIGSAMPTLILGPGLTAAATALGSWWLIILSVVMILSGGGDFLIILKVWLYKSPNKEALYYDHPYELGVVAFEKP